MLFLHVMEQPLLLGSILHFHLKEICSLACVVRSDEYLLPTTLEPALIGNYLVVLTNSRPSCCDQ